MTEQHFEDARLLVCRGENHLDELQDAIKKFYADDPWTTYVEPIPDTSEYCYKIRPAKRLNPKLKPVAADAANNFRSALDHVTCECALLNGAKNVQKIHFPFRPTAAEFEKAISDNRLKDLPSEILAYFRTLKPYIGGNDRLYGLTRMSARNKHRSLTPMSLTPHGFQILHADGRQRIVQTHRWSSNPEDDLELFTSPSADEKYQYCVLITLSFDGTEPSTKGHPVTTLRYLAGVVKDAISECEAICRRLQLL